MPTPTLISTDDLREQLSSWRAVAECCRDKQEQALIRGKGTLAIAADFGAQCVETCVADLERLIRDGDEGGEVL